MSYRILFFANVPGPKTYLSNIQVYHLKLRSVNRYLFCPVEQAKLVSSSILFQKLFVLKLALN